MAEFKLEVGKEFSIIVRKEKKKNKKSRNAVWRGGIAYFPREYF